MLLRREERTIVGWSGLWAVGAWADGGGRGLLFSPLLPRFLLPAVCKISDDIIGDTRMNKLQLRSRTVDRPGGGG